MRFTVLGPVELEHGGRLLPGAAPRHRAVLAYLLLHAGTVVGIERLIGAMWGADVPGTARSQVHAAVTSLRRVLRSAPGGDRVLVTRGAGYLATLEPGQLDLDRFAAHVSGARRLATAADRGAAATELRAALALWRGQPLADVNGDYVPLARRQLADRRLAAVEQLADLELEDGRHEQLIGELAALVTEHPLRERLAGQLMLALHRSGRQADALATGRALRTALADTQGLDPGREFTTLEARILRDDPSLLAVARPSGKPVGNAGPASAQGETAGAPSAQGETADPPSAQAETAGPASTAVPAPLTEPVSAHLPDAVAPASQARRLSHLPSAIPDFTGRPDELDRLQRAVTGSGDAPTIAAINGMAGSGKTSLAVHAARSFAARFPDGQLFVDLDAHSTGRNPVSADTALEVLLRQLGVPSGRIPHDTAARSALWRAELSGRSVVAVLDNAANAAQVRPLLPGDSDCLVMITSRRRLMDLDGAQALSLEPLAPQDAEVLFTGIVGERAAAEPLAVLDVLQLCGFLPLAVRIAAARLHHRPTWSVAHAAARLRDQRRRLAELTAGDRSVTAAFALSYQQLTGAQQRMFRLAGLHPGRDFDARAAAALADLPVEEADVLLEDLLDVHMLEQRQADRYTFHDLLRAHAHETAFAQEPEPARDAAVNRLFDHYRSTAATAVGLLFPGARQLRLAAAPQATTAVPLTDAEQALAWLDSERGNLVAVDGAPHSHVGPLAALLSPFLYDYGHHTDALALHGRARVLARAAGERTCEARAALGVAWVSLRQGRYRTAHEDAEQALELSRAAGDRHVQARALNLLGNLCWRQADFAPAADWFDQALALYRECGDPVGETHALGNKGLALAGQGEFALAEKHLLEALERYRAAGDGEVLEQAIVLSHLAVLSLRQGRAERAESLHQEALGLLRRLGNDTEEADALNAFGEAALEMGDAARAVQAHRSALELDRARGLQGTGEPDRAQRGLTRASRAAEAGSRT